ncbi:MAG: hypothetical protein REI11_20050, partial [Patulibacter sp.]|nr:hypothetical protein [Patulibacter sp.]
SGVVPDGVAAVRGTTRAGQVVTTRVVNNSFQLLAPGRDSGPDTAANGASRPDLPSLSGQFKHQSVEWLDENGKVLRHLPE